MTAPRTRLPATVATLAAAGLLLAGCGSVSLVPGSPDQSERGGDDVAAVKRVEVESRSGTIQVRPGADGSSRVDRVLEWSGDVKPTLTQEVRGDTLHVVADCPDGSDDCNVELVITVPAATAVKADLGAGNVAVTGLTGEQELSSGAGNVGGVNLGAAPVKATTPAGNVDLSFAAAPPTVDAQSSAGNVTVRVPTGPVYEVDTGSTVGNVRVEVPDTPGADHRISARSSAGNVSVIPG
ncbi:DUF4097 family beta strand repeat-containing protein [Pseudonocardia endophytica]|uniref:DUF4097 domain-containing protein n=1 Tax=Pseudonocardia endophytica TaxID=401976 RepID=A0A4V2PIH5_PSEEN|nr:DUF4097 family beta strand repeat-containing protein [Pseudonocardia endophytica]TCK24676.1 hypothetical protein EV378_0462 [Pseudonocardia endophytica]